MRQLAILGAGGHGRVVAESASALGWAISFFDEAQSGVIDGHAVVGQAADLMADVAAFDGVIVAIGANRARLAWTMKLQAAGAQLATIADAKSHVSASATIGAGSYIACGAIVITGARLGRACIINTAASVDHDCILGDSVHLSPGVHLSGNVTIGDASWLGTGTSVRNGVQIGSDVVCGVGSAVVNNLADHQTVVGVPARLLKRP